MTLPESRTQTARPAAAATSLSVCRCGSPLISTFVFSGVEWYCLDCGSAYGWFDPRNEPWTAELAAQHEALVAEARPLLAALVVNGSRLKDCQRCNAIGLGDHNDHATEEEWAADKAARDALRERSSRGRA